MGTTRRHGSVVAAVLLGAVAVLAACGSESAPGGGTSSGGSAPPSAPTLAGTSWLLSGYAAAGGNIRPVAAAAGTATLSFGAGGSASGSTGCNRFTGSYTQSGSALTVDPGATTEMSCAPPVMAQERSVLEGLSATRSFGVAGTALTLRDGSGAAVLTYSAGTTDLAGTSWRATGINNGAGAVQTSADTARVTAVFGRNGTLSGNGGCNSYSATWATKGVDGLVLGPVSSTTMACDAMETEAQYFAALARVTRYRIVGDTLTLRDTAGATQATFARVAD